MKISREEKKMEAVARMKALGIFPPTIKQFKDGDFVSVSMPPVGAFFWTEGECLNHIRDFEEKHNALVYVVIRTYTNMGMMDSYLYVSDYQEEWDQDNEDIKNMEPLVYVYNHDMTDCSEFGCIGIQKTAAAGLQRIW